MRISESIARFIQERLEEMDGTAEIQRNELANQFHCVPSQINYVITSRFTPELGYVVESRRGGGGYIRIRRVVQDKPDIMHLVNCIGDSLDSQTAQVFVKNLLYNGVLSEESFRLVAAALSDKSYADVPVECRDALRARLLKNLLIQLEG